MISEIYFQQIQIMTHYDNYIITSINWTAELNLIDSNIIVKLIFIKLNDR